MSKNEKNLIEVQLKLYPDVVKELGGEDIVNNEAILEVVNDYINKHKWFVNQQIPRKITLEEGFFSWHENVFIPQINEMKRLHVFPRLHHLDHFTVFKMVSEEYYRLNSSDDVAYYTAACKSVIKREDQSIFRKRSA